jgi:hypothetical protein
MPKNSIYLLLGKPQMFIRYSYTGDAVDVNFHTISGLFDNDNYFIIFRVKRELNPNLIDFAGLLQNHL